MAQMDSNNLDWSDKYLDELARIKNLEAQGQNRSAYVESMKVLDSAVSNHNIPGIIAVMDPFIRNISRVEDDAMQIAMVKLSSIRLHNPVMEAVVNSYLAELLTMYFEQNRYLISQEPDQQTHVWEDLNQWSTNQFEKTIDSLYATSVQSEVLAEISSQKLQSVIVSQEPSAWELRPRLFDLLLERQMKFLKNQRLHWEPKLRTVDSAAVELLNQVDLSDYLATVQNSRQFDKILKAYHHWEKSLLGSDEIRAYLDVIVQRINYVNGYTGARYWQSSIPIFDELKSNYPGIYSRLKLDYEKAQLLVNYGEYQKAIEILRQAPHNGSESELERSIGQIQNLIHTIQEPEITVQIEEVYASKVHPLVAIQFRNVGKVQLEVYSITEQEYIENRFRRYSTDHKKLSFLNRRALWQNLINLPPTKDYKRHSTETIINKSFRKGTYALRYWYDKDKVKIEGVVVFQITDLGLIISSDGEENNLMVVHTQTGEKRKGARVEAISIHRDGRQRNKEVRLVREVKTGVFLPPEISHNTYYKIRLGDDQYISPLINQPYIHTQNSDPVAKAHILTDRAVYKPGQTIYFKALAARSYQLESELIKNQKVEIFLRDANRKIVWEKSYQTDEWGTVTGTIPIPISGLKGNWSLTASPSGNAAIVVEEYQRPNFEITMPDSGISRDSGKITISGQVETYHGFPVQNGQGTVEVQLERRSWFYGRNPEYSEQIYSGEFTTDENGSYNIRFDSEALDRPEFRYGSIYFYSIHASVQAASGEIREITKDIPLDPDRNVIRIDIPDFQELENLKPIRFTVQNALQQSQSQEVEFRLSQLDAPDNYKVDRFWDVPDMPVLTENEFLKEYRHFNFDRNSTMDLWGERKTLQSWEQTIKDKDSLSLAKFIESPGYYRLLVKDAQGDTLAVQSFGIGPMKKKSIVHDAIEITTNKNEVRPGETLRLKFYTPQFNEGGQIRIIFPDGRIENYDLDQTRDLEIEVKEKDRGGIHVRVFGILANRFYSETLTITVPWSNKELTIQGLDEIATLPLNSDTAIDLVVKDEKGIGKLSEVTMAIYDASLDVYKVHDWLAARNFFRSFQDPTTVYNATGRLGDLVTSENNYWELRPDVKHLHYPALPTFYFNFRNSIYSRSQQRMYMTMENSIAGDMAAPVLFAKAESEVEMQIPESPSIRKDFEETVLFVGKSITDSTGQLRIPFRTNDKAGRWKMMVFAHTPDLESGVRSHTFETSQDLFLESFLPGIVRQGDQMELAFTLFNNSEENVSGQILFSVQPLFDNETAVGEEQRFDFTLDGGKSTLITIPFHVDRSEKGLLVLTTRMLDQNGKLLDAIEEVLPVLSSVETVHDGQVFVLENGQKWKGANFEGISHDSRAEVTVRIIQNLHTELLKSIPYLQITNPVTTDQYFRNGVQAIMGQHIVEQVPNFDRIYSEWKRKGELKSRLAQNEDKKYAALTNTPWERHSNSGTEQMALLDLYFDDLHIRQVAESNLTKWIESQNADGGFPWIKNGTSSFFMTVRFLAQWNKLAELGLGGDIFTDVKHQLAQQYADEYFIDRWEKIKNDTTRLGLYYQQFIPYFKQRSFDLTAKNHSEKFLQYWDELKDSVYTNWAVMDFADRAEIGIAAHHLGDDQISRTIVKSFLDNAVNHKSLGTYWRYNHRTFQNGYLGTLSKISELLVLNNESSLNDGIIQWVLVNGMTNDWHRNPNVSDLMLNLLKMSDQWTTTSRSMVTIGDRQIMLDGLGNTDDIQLSLNDMHEFEVQHMDGPPIWVGISTSREAEPEEMITQSGDNLQIDKTIIGATDSDSLTQGDQLTIQLRIRSDRDLDYVYIQDPIVPGMDPGISLSGHKWQYGLSYYQSFDPSKVELFIRHLPKGDYLLEYNLGVVRPGAFRSPRTKIQSYFVPEINGFDQWRPLVKTYKK